MKKLQKWRFCPCVIDLRSKVADECLPVNVQSKNDLGQALACENHTSADTKHDALFNNTCVVVELDLFFILHPEKGK